MVLKTFVENISKENIFSYVVISICILYFFTNVVNIELGHVLALVVTILVLVYLTLYNNEDVEDFNKDLEFKMKSLLSDGTVPSHFYIDADLINLFFNIKQDIAEYNYDSYKNAVQCANIVLRIKYDIERDLCNSPLFPDIRRQFSPCVKDQYNIVDDKKCKNILVNAYENYQAAEEYLKKCMNYLHSLVIVIPSDPVTEGKHASILKRVHVLLKRNLDDIKIRYEKSLERGISHNTKFIGDFDDVKAFNKHAETNSLDTGKINLANSNFNFF